MGENDKAAKILKTKEFAAFLIEIMNYLGSFLLHIPNDRKVFAIWQIVKRIVRKRAGLFSSALASNKKARQGKMVSPQRIMVFAAA